MTITKSTLFWLAMSTLPMMLVATFAVGPIGCYLMAFFGICFITLWKTYPKERP